MASKIVATAPNKSGAHVNVIEDCGRFSWQCTGCGGQNIIGGGRPKITEGAQDHANTCSFLPKD